MIEALAAIGGGGMAIAIVAIVVLAFKLSASKDDVIAARDRIEKLDERADIAETDLKLETAAHAVTRSQLKTEQNLRAVAEAKLNQAQRRVRELLAAHLKDASDEEIQAATAHAFADFDGVPLSEGGPDGTSGLIDPFADVPPA